MGELAPPAVHMSQMVAKLLCTVALLSPTCSVNKFFMICLYLGTPAFSPALPLKFPL